MAADTVYVGSKMPLGLTLNLDTSLHVNKDSLGSVPVTRVIAGKLAPVTLKGTGYKQGIEAPPVMVDGYVFTPVPKVFWDQWLETHADFGPLLDGYIMPAATMDAAKGKARERENERGHNPRLVENDERVRGMGVAKFSKEDA